jgi:drug/metabolite transporter (DMT)-like permease
VDETKKGLVYGIVGTLLVGFQPIVANSRPAVLDAYIFAAMTCIVETIIFLPLVIKDLLQPFNKQITREIRKYNAKKILNNWRANLKTLIFIGFIFGLNQLLFFIGYQLAGAINGSLTQKTTVFFSLIFGYTILKEQIDKRQIFFSIILFLGLFLAITQGKFTLLNSSTMVGVIVLLFITCLWMFGHTITKPILNRKEVTASQMVFLRNFLSGIILISTYFIFYPFNSLKLLLLPLNMFYTVAMGAVYGFGLYCWYKTLTYLDVSIATIIFSLTPIVTALFATFLLNEIFTIFHLIGTVIIVFSIIFIMKGKKSTED